MWIACRKYLYKIVQHLHFMKADPFFINPPVGVFESWRIRRLFGLYLNLRLHDELGGLGPTDSTTLGRVEQILMEKPFPKKIEFWRGSECSLQFKEFYKRNFIDLEDKVSRVVDYDSRFKEVYSQDR